MGLEERKLPQTTMTVMGETDVLFILTPVEGQVPGFLTLNVLVTETSLGLPAFATAWRYTKLEIRAHKIRVCF